MKVRNVSIDLFRFLAACSIMFLHVGWNMNSVLLTKHPIIEIYAGRYWVLFFFVISGYYYCNMLLNRKDPFVHQFKSLLKTYVIWTIVYYLMSFVTNILISKNSVKEFLVQRVQYFFTEGSYPHLWYMVALIYALVLVHFVYKFFEERGLIVLSMISVILFVVGVLGAAYLPLCSNIPMLKSLYGWSYYFVFRNVFCLGLPGFMLGYFVVKTEQKMANSKLNTISLLFWLVISIVECMILIRKGFTSSFTSLLFMPFVHYFFLIFLLQHPMAQFEKWAMYLKRMSSFIYFVHPALIAVFAMITNMGQMSLSIWASYLIILILVLVTGGVLLKWNTHFSKLLI